MLNLVFPIGHMHGWGVCGHHLTKELSRVASVRLISDPFGPEEAGGELEHRNLMRLFVDKNLLASELDRPLPGAMIQPVNNDTFGPWEPRIKGLKNLGYIFYEQDRISPGKIANARASFDFIAAGSSWCQEILAKAGCENTATVVQGVDRALFNGESNQKTVFPDNFLIFGGGKFELRKGQDLVLMAAKVMMDRHPEVMLVASWYNGWPQSMASMTASPHIRFELKQDYFSSMQATLAATGIDPDRVILLPPMHHQKMATVYKNTDLGVFPNRCEGGTNLVLMEYLACGKPALASNSSGHKDVAGEHNTIMLNQLRPLRLNNPKTGRSTVWDDPDPSELVEKMEWAFQNRGAALARLGMSAAKSMEPFTWQAAAKRFMELIGSLG